MLASGFGDGKLQRMMKRLLAIFFLLSASSALAQPGRGPVPVQVAEVQLIQMASTTLVPGTVISRHDARIAAEVAGVLTMVAEVGTVVTIGEPLAAIDKTQLALRRTELAAQVERESARLGFLTKEEARLSKLTERNITARTQLDQVRSERDVAIGDRAVASARLAQVEDQLQRSQIAAPFAGVVVERLARPGERVSVSDRVVRLVDPNDLEVIARAPLEIMPYLTPGDELPVRGSRRDTLGVVRTLVAVGDEDTHQFETRIDLPPAEYPVGQTVRVTLPASDSRQVIAVPRDALVLRADGISVFVVGIEGEVTRISVETGLADGDWIEISGSVNVGDRVVIRGNERLRGGQQVSVQAAS